MFAEASSERDGSNNGYEDCQDTMRVLFGGQKMNVDG